MREAVGDAELAEEDAETSSLSVSSVGMPSRTGDEDPYPARIQTAVSKWALILTLGMCGVMVSISGVLLYQGPSKGMNEEGALSDGVYLAGVILPLKNLVHASLLGAAAVVVQVRGDVVWYFFVRNTAFYFTWAALPYALLFRFNDPTIMTILSVLLTAMSSLAFLQYVRSAEWNGFLGRRNRALTILSWLVQCVAIPYAFVVLMRPNDDMDVMPLLEAYSVGAHQAFLLALVHLASVYPTHLPSLGGATLACFWRLLAAAGSLAAVLRIDVNGLDDHFLVDWRWSALFTAYEATSMLMILVVCVRLLNGPTTLCAPAFASYEAVSSAEGVSTAETGLRTEPMSPHSTSLCPSILHPSLVRLALSPEYSNCQRAGAAMLFCGSFFLLAEMTVECLIMLQDSEKASDVHFLEQWGMHVVAIFCFCTFMAVETPAIYHRCRLLLGTASPMGSVIASWQLYSDSVLQTATILLLVTRIICGVVQTIGVGLLDSIAWVDELKNETKFCQQLPIPCQDDTVLSDDSDAALSAPNRERMRTSSSTVRSQLKIATVAVYIVTFGSVLFLLPRCDSNDDGFHFLSMLPNKEGHTAPHWPGLDVIFHYGVLIVLFACLSSSYAPSRTICILFLLHLLLIGGYSALIVSRGTSDAVTLLWLAASAALASVLLWEDAETNFKPLHM